MIRRPQIMGIVNITPDSFSGDGLINPGDALAHAEHLLKDGADCLDIGAYSSRPGAPFVSEEAELSRLLPALTMIRHALPCPLFVDTTRPGIAKHALDLGTNGINIIEGLSVSQTFWDVLAAYPQSSVILMHNPLPARPDAVTLPHGSKAHPPHVYPGGVVHHVKEDLKKVISRSPLDPKRIMIDPGLGFGKSTKDNLLLIREALALATLGHPVVLGASRKSFLGEIVKKDTNHRVFSGLAAMIYAAPHVQIIRTHDVSALSDALTMGEALKDLPQ